MRKSFATWVGMAVAVMAIASTVANADSLADCRQLRNRDARLAACTSIIEAAGAPDDQKAIAYRQRGALRLDAGAFDAALADLNEAVRRAPGDAGARLYRAEVRIGRNDLDGAQADFDEAIKLAPNTPNAFNGRGHLSMVRGNLVAAIADFSRAIALSPRSATALNNRGLAYRKAGNTEQAIADYTTAINLNPIYALAYANRGAVYEGLGRKAEATEDFRAALFLDPSLVSAKEGLARQGVADAYTLDSVRLAAQGKDLVETNCSRCHATGRDGASPNTKAPPFRTIAVRHPMLALREPLSRGIAAPHDEMPKFQLPPSDVDKIVAYINSLSP